MYIIALVGGSFKREFLQLSPQTRRSANCENMVFIWACRRGLVLRIAGGDRVAPVAAEGPFGDPDVGGGLDKRSSLDSVQQALFFSHVTGKRPVVVIYDTDGREGRFEYRIRIACRKAGVRYEVFRKRAVEIST